MPAPPDELQQRSESDLREDLRERILAEATSLFADGGYSRTSMRQVAEAAGCTKPALYYHFGSKEELFRAAVGACLSGLQPILAQVGQVRGSTRDRLLAFARGMFESLRSNPTPMRLMLAMQTRPDHSQPDIDFAAYHERNHSLLREVFRTGIDSGEIRRDVDLDTAITALTGALHARAFLALKGVPTPPDTAERVVDLLFRGIGTTAASSPSRETS